MNEQQITEFMLATKAEIAALWESTKSSHKRIDGTGELTASVNQLAKEVAKVVEKVEHIAERIDKNVERIEQGQKEQGARIGAVEKAVMTISNNERALDKHEKKLEEISKAPAEKWEKFTWLVFTVAATAILSFIMGRFL